MLFWKFKSAPEKTHIRETVRSERVGEERRGRKMSNEEQRSEK